MKKTHPLLLTVLLLILATIIFSTISKVFAETDSVSNSENSSNTVQNTDSNDNAAQNPEITATLNTSDSAPSSTNWIPTSSFPTSADRDRIERELEDARNALTKANALLSDIDLGIVTNVPRATALAAQVQAQQYFQSVLAQSDAINAALASLQQAFEIDAAAQKAGQDKLTNDLDSALLTGNSVAIRSALVAASNLRANYYSSGVAFSGLVNAKGLEEAINQAVSARSGAGIDEKAGIAASITILNGGTIAQAAENASKQGGLIEYAATLISDQASVSDLTTGVVEEIAKRVVTYAYDQATKNKASINMAEVITTLAALNVSQEGAVKIISEVTKVNTDTIRKTVIAAMQASIVQGAQLTGAYSGIPNSPEALAAASLPKPPVTPAPITGPRYVTPPPENGTWPEAHYAYSTTEGSIGGTSLTTFGIVQNNTFTEGTVTFQVINTSGGSNTIRVNLAGSPAAVTSALLQNPTAAQFQLWLTQNSFAVQPDGTYKR